MQFFLFYVFFFFNDTATTEIYTLSLHDALPISRFRGQTRFLHRAADHGRQKRRGLRARDRKSTRLNSSHPSISYAVFCLKKKKKNKQASRRSTCGGVHRSRSRLGRLRSSTWHTC